MDDEYDNTLEDSSIEEIDSETSLFTGDVTSPINYDPSEGNTEETCTEETRTNEIHFGGHTSGKCNLCGCTHFRPSSDGKYCLCGHSDYDHVWI